MDAWQLDRIVHDDDEVVIVDKPEGVTTHRSSGSVADDVASRVSSQLGAPVRLSRPLPAAVSGLVALSRSREGARLLARGFEAGRVRSTYVAVVEGTPSGDGGGLSIRTLESVGGRGLVDVRGVATPRQVLAVLAELGHPVFGDRDHGGPPAFRTMLHRSALRVPDLAEARTSIPGALLRQLRGARALDDRAGIDDALAAAAQRRWELSRDPDTTAFRWVDEAGDELPGVAVDLYGAHAVLRVAEQLDAPTVDRLVAALRDLGAAGVYLKRRPKQASIVVDARGSRFAPPEPVSGTAAEPEPWVREAGVAYRVRLGDGLSTGLFLDQRDNRRFIREVAAGARVLNLFAYTCAFGAAAAAGGAKEVVHVDASGPSLERGRAMLEAVGGGSATVHRFVRADAFATLDELSASGERFDVVVCDPPTYSKTRRSRWTSGRDYRSLAAAVFAVLAEGGVALLCSNDRRMSERAFLEHLRQAARHAGRDLDLDVCPGAVDHPWSAPKAVIARPSAGSAGGRTTGARTRPGRGRRGRGPRRPS